MIYPDSLVIVTEDIPPLIFGEAARVLGRSNLEALVLGLESRQQVTVGVHQLISLDDADDDCSLYLEVHDYVFEGDDE